MTFIAVFLAAVFWIPASTSFTPVIQIQSATVHVARSSRTTASPVSLLMGLFDTPLPPRRNKKDSATQDEIADAINDNDSEDDDNDHDEAVLNTQNLFRFQESGREAKDLLPRLRRRLDYDIDCYYEETDRLVQNLMGKTGCTAHDAAWALEACQGDVTEAWTRISFAQRLALEAQRAMPAADTAEDDGEDDLLLNGGREESSIYSLLIEEEFQERKASREKAAKERSLDQLLNGGAVDDQWLPTENPRPVDDEPWFTG